MNSAPSPLAAAARLWLGNEVAAADAIRDDRREVTLGEAAPDTPRGVFHCAPASPKHQSKSQQRSTVPRVRIGARCPAHGLQVLKPSAPRDTRVRPAVVLFAASAESLLGCEGLLRALFAPGLRGSAMIVGTPGGHGIDGQEEEVRRVQPSFWS
jgi:hypothetical protein